MPNWRKLIVSGSDAALNSLNVTSALTASGFNYPTVDGTLGQVISTDGSGNLSFSSVSATDAEATHIPVKNTTVSQIDKGTPVYITGNVGNSERLEIAPADASDASKMPAVGLLETTLAVNGEGYVVQGGYLRQLTTDTIDGTATTSNDTVYVKVGGGLTMTKPTGSDGLIQNIAKIARSHGSAGSVIVSSILRTNDVPNLPTGKIWVGSAANTVTSSVVHLDETNGRLGIGTTSPTQKLEVREGFVISSGSGVSDTGFVLDRAGLDTYQLRHMDGGFTVYNSTETRKEMSFNGAGNVGIGKTSPSYKLDVAGDVRVLSSSISYQENTDVDSAAAETVATVTKADFDGAFFDYLIKSGSNLRAGTVTAIHDGTDVEYNEVSTQDLGSTSAVELSVDISGADMRLRATTTSDNWLIKSLVRTL